MNNKGILSFIGSGNAFNELLGNNSCYIQNNDNLFLIDCGSSVFHNLLESSILKNIKKIDILITHTHPDHIGSLGDLIFYCKYALSIKPSIYFPDISFLSSLLDLMGVSKIYYHIYKQNPSISFEKIDVCHVSSMMSYGYILNYENKKIYYSGDSKCIPTKVLHNLDNIEYFYQDTSSINNENNPHMSLEELTKEIPKYYRNKVYCMHLDKDFDIEKATNLGFNVVNNEFKRRNYGY